MFKLILSHRCPLFLYISFQKQSKNQYLFYIETHLNTKICQFSVYATIFFFFFQTNKHYLSPDKQVRIDCKVIKEKRKQFISPDKTFYCIAK